MAEELKKDVTDSSPEGKQEVKIEEKPASQEQKPPHGYVPYQAMNEEREKRKKLEDRLEKLEEEIRSSTTPEDENYDDLDDTNNLKKEVSSLKEEVVSMKESFAKERLQQQYSWLQDKWEDVEEFRKEYPRTALDKVVKLFALEHDLLGNSNQPQRQGLEKPTAGTKVPQSSGFSKEDVQRLREDNPRKYIDMIRSGKLKAEDIS